MTKKPTDRSKTNRWLVLVYQFPQGPGSLRVKIWRRLQAIGAVAIKHSMYVLPLNEQSLEDFQWLLKELGAGGAEGAILEAELIDGLDDAQVRALFDQARAGDYAELIEELRAQLEALPRRDPGDDELGAARQSLVRLRKRRSEIDAIDFFGAPGREEAERLVRRLEGALSRQTETPAEDQRGAGIPLGELKNRVWVTRRRVRVDRIASAWLIRREIDPGAVFKFTARRDYPATGREVRFDMYEAEFTHRGDRCTFEVLAEALGGDDPALARLAEIVHDIDLKDAKYRRPETPGIAHLLDGLAAATADDDLRLERGAIIFESLYRYFRDQPG